MSEVCSVQYKVNPTSVLEAAKACIADVSTWGQGSYARDKTGRSAYPRSKQACRFCAVGAVMRVSQKAEAHTRAVHYLNAATRLLGHNNIGVISANDKYRLDNTHQHEIVLAIYDKAIELSKEDR